MTAAAREFGLPMILGVWIASTSVPRAWTFITRPCWSRRMEVGANPAASSNLITTRCTWCVFGEYMPFVKSVPWLQSLSPLGTSASPGERPKGFMLKNICLAPNICYETVLPHVIRNQLVALRQEGHEPQILVNVTNDGWFWGSSELEQHLACGVFRTVECRRPMVIAANTGISASIDANGRILAEGPLRQTTRSSPTFASTAAKAGICVTAIGSPASAWRRRSFSPVRASWLVRRRRYGWDKLAVRQAFQPDASVRLESLTYSERRPTLLQLAKPLDGSASVARNAVFSDHRCGLARLVRITVTPGSPQTFRVGIMVDTGKWAKLY